MSLLEEYYNKFNEDKRLSSRHGQVEYTVSMHYIHQYLKEQMEITGKKKQELRILDIGAATGGYSIPLSEEGYDVTAVELVKHNISRLKQKCDGVTAFQRDARNLRGLESEAYDLTLLFGPMYHLKTREDQRKALLEAKRVTRPGGVILVAYIMNEYSVITYAFKERHIREALMNGMLDESYHCTEKANPLYSFMRLEDIESLNGETGLKREKIIAVDGAANYIRPVLNALDEEEFQMFLDYQLSVCERTDLMGASGHTVDILRR